MRLVKVPAFVPPGNGVAFDVLDSVDKEAAPKGCMSIL
jgi:hypothetical protein